MKKEPVNDVERLVGLAIEGGRHALATLFDHFRGQLRKMVRLCMDRRLQGRNDPLNILQGAYLDVAQLLGLSISAASNRYVRALARLQGVLQSMPCFLEQAT